MIILDEQLLEHDIEENISKWYRGAVRFVTELRPNTIIRVGWSVGLRECSVIWSLALLTRLQITYETSYS